MLRPKTALGLLTLGTVACGGGAPPPPEVVKPPPLVVTAAPPPVRARWVFSHPEQGLTGKLDLGDGSVLYCGRNGRRELVKGSDAPVDAQTLALDDLVGVLKDDKGQFAFVADDGDVFLSSTPLGTLDTEREGPTLANKNAKIHSVTTGRAVFAALTTDGKLLRTADFGQSWKEVDYAGGSKPYGKPTSLALDGRGNGLLLHLPQRLFVTSDDGATWKPIASPGIGARRVRRDGAGKLYLDGYGGKRAKLDGAALVVTTEPEQPMYRPPTAPKVARPFKTRTLLSGDRVVELSEVEHDGRTLAIEVSSTKLGAKPDKPVQVSELAGYEGVSEIVASYKSDIAYLRFDADGEDPGATSTLFRSTDFGATWKKDATFDGVEMKDPGGTTIAVGPKGWTYINALCPRDPGGYGYDEEEDHSDEPPPDRTDCGRRQIRVAGGSQFEDMTFVEEFTPTDFAFDEARDKVYVIGLHNEKQYVYESSLSQNKFTRTKVLEADSYAATALTVDPKGTLRVFEHDSNKGWILRRRDVTGKEQPPLYVPLDQGSLSLVGARGILFAGHDRGWETNDGGETWMRVATNGFVRNLACTEAGCINGGAQRIGWDLPAVTNQEKIAALTEPKPKPPYTPPPPPPSPSVPRVELACKPAGTPSNLASVPASDMVDNRAEARWATIKRDPDGKAAMLVATRTAVKEIALPRTQGPLTINPTPKPAPNAKTPQPEHRYGERVLPEGVIFAHYSFLPSTGAGYNPVDVELAWYSAATGKVQKQTLKQVKPFRVGRYGFSGSPAIVEGGLLFRPDASQPVQFIHDDGKVETFTMPSTMGNFDVVHQGKKWVYADLESGGLTLGLSEDSGKTWKSRAWGLDETGSTTLTLMGDKPTVTLAKGSLPGLLFDVGSVADDPPAPIVMDASNADIACDAKAGLVRFTQSIPYDKRTFKGIVESKSGKDVSQVKFTASTRVMHGLQGGKLCTSAYVANGSDPKSGDYQTAFFYPEGKDAWSGWRFRKSDDKTRTVAEPLTCTIPK